LQLDVLHLICQNNPWFIYGILAAISISYIETRRTGYAQAMYNKCNKTCKECNKTCKECNTYKKIEIIVIMFSIIMSFMKT